MSNIEKKMNLERKIETLEEAIRIDCEKLDIYVSFIKQLKELKRSGTRFGYERETKVKLKLQIDEIYELLEDEHSLPRTEKEIIELKNHYEEIVERWEKYTYKKENQIDQIFKFEILTKNENINKNSSDSYSFNYKFYANVIFLLFIYKFLKYLVIKFKKKVM